MNDLLELTFNGYTPDEIGCLAYLINKSLPIPESKIREILNIPLSESVTGLRQNLEKNITQKTFETLAAKSKSSLYKPTIQDIRNEMLALFPKILQQRPKETETLAAYLLDAWEDFQGAAEPPDTSPGDQADDIALVGRLRNVPTMGELETEKRFKSYQNLPRPLSTEPPKTISKMPGYTSQHIPKQRGAPKYNAEHNKHQNQ